MIKLIPVDIDNQVLLNNIISKKHRRNITRCQACGKQDTLDCETCDNYDNRALMETIQPYVFERYDFYASHTDDLDTIKQEGIIAGHTKDLLINSYDSSADFQRARSVIFERMPTAIRAKCPFCMISAPHTLDHYFDKEDYPEYAVYIPNLIPCCFDCNVKKSTHMFLPNGERTVLHFYYDKIPDYQFLFMNIEMEDNIPVINISLRLDETIRVDNIIKNHFATLELKKRYKEQLNDQLSNIVIEFKEYYQQGQDILSLINMLNVRVYAYHKNNGMNYWLACLYDGLAKNPEVFEKMLSAT